MHENECVVNLDSISGEIEYDNDSRPDQVQYTKESSQNYDNTQVDQRQEIDDDTGHDEGQYPIFEKESIHPS